MKKELMTTEQIDTHYPVHAKVKQLDAQIKGAQKFAEFMKEQGIHFCISVDPEEWEGQEYAIAYGWSAYGGANIEKVFQAFGIDYDEFMREKDDMLAQIRMRFEESES